MEKEHTAQITGEAYPLEANARPHGPRHTKHWQHGSGETIKSVDTFTIKSKSSIANPATYMSTYAKWSVVTQQAP